MLDGYKINLTWKKWATIKNLFCIVRKDFGLSFILQKRIDSRAVEVKYSIPVLALNLLNK